MNKILLKTKSITKKYGLTEVLKGIDLDIFKGEIISLLGVNGAGKTTLSSIIATLHPATSGEIEFEGKSVYSNIEKYRLKLGYCPQAPNLNGMLTLEENLKSSGIIYGLSDEIINERLAILTERFELKKYLNQKAHVLSGGYKQRFMIARSLLHKPNFIILDEPTVGLDPHIRRELWDVIKSLKNDGITILLTTHYLDEAEKLSDRVCFLEKGQIKLIDTPEKLLTDSSQKNLEDMFVELIKQSER